MLQQSMHTKAGGKHKKTQIYGSKIVLYNSIRCSQTESVTLGDWKGQHQNSGAFHLSVQISSV